MYICVRVYIRDWKNWIGFEVGSWFVGKKGEGEEEKKKGEEKARRVEN